jgi:hypothetical protein
MVDPSLAPMATSHKAWTEAALANKVAPEQPNDGDMVLYGSTTGVQCLGATGFASALCVRHCSTVPAGKP